MKEELSVLLMFRLLEAVRESGVNQTEARCALGAAIALLPELDLESKPTAVYGEVH
jgi:hypothetical protein